MSKIEIPEQLRSKLGPDMKMDVHWIDVKLRNGEIFRRLVVRGSRYITGRANDENGEGPLPFNSGDIAKIRRESIWLWPFW
jgi:hypothetical protein